MTPEYNSPEWHTLMAQVQQHHAERVRQNEAFKASLEGQSILKSLGHSAPIPTQYPLYEDSEPETLEPVPAQPTVTTRATLQTPTITLSSFDAAFQIALSTAEDQYFPYRQTLGDALYRFATVIRACALLYNTKAQSRAVLCAMLPFKFVAEFCGYSREYIYQQLRTTEAGTLFKRLIAFDAHVSSYKIIPKNAPEGADPVRAHDGTLFTTRPTPCAANNPPKAAHWDWTRAWRDMYSDVRDGRTVANAIQSMNAIAPRAERRTWNSSHTQATKANIKILQIAKDFFYLSLSSFNSLISVVSICEPERFEAVHDALNEPIPSTSDGRNMWVDRLAKRVYECVRDSKADDLNGWLARAWTIAKAVVYSVGPAREVFLEALWMVLSREVNGTVKNLGAYLNAVLKARGWESLEAECSKLRLGSSATA
jgi:hypothetical protein